MSAVNRSAAIIQQNPCLRKDETGKKDEIYRILNKY